MSVFKPKSILLHERVHYNWLHPRMIERFKAEHGIRFTILTPRNKNYEQRKSIIGPDDRLVALEDIPTGTRYADRSWAEEGAIAREYERKYNCSYMRDLVQQDRWASSYFVGNTQNSYFGQVPPPPIQELTRDINSYFAFFEEIFEKDGIDCVIGWPSYSIVSAVTHHMAMASGIPGTFLTSGRKASLLMWSDGPYVGSRLVRAQVERERDAPVAEIKMELPRDTREAMQDMRKEERLSFFVNEVYKLARDHVIWGLQDILKTGKLQRMEQFKRSFLPNWYRWHVGVQLKRRWVSDIDSITKNPYVLFLLPYEPEFPSNSLSREFNDTLAVVRQCALSIPAGMQLVVKEHVVGIGNRRLSFYDDLLRYPNVTLADNKIPGQVLARQAAAVSTVNGTVGLEAGLLGKRAVIFSRNIEYSYLPHVRVVDKFADLPQAFRWATESRSPEDAARIREAATRHLRAVESLSINVEDIDVFFGTKSELTEEQYARVFAMFFRSYDELARDAEALPHLVAQRPASLAR